MTSHRRSLKPTAGMMIARFCVAGLELRCVPRGIDETLNYTGTKRIGPASVERALWLRLLFSLRRRGTSSTNGLDGIAVATASRDCNIYSAEVRAVGIRDDNPAALPTTSRV